MDLELLSTSLEQWSSRPASIPSPVTRVFALCRVRLLKRMVSTTTTFVWWLQTYLQLVPRPPPPLSGGQCCTCFSTRKYRVSPKTGGGVVSSLQPSFFCKATEHLLSVVWGFCNEEQLWWLLAQQKPGETLPKHSCAGRGEALVKRLELERQVCSQLHFEGYWGTFSGQSTLFPIFGIDANLF